MAATKVNNGKEAAQNGSCATGNSINNSSILESTDGQGGVTSTEVDDVSIPDRDSVVNPFLDKIKEHSLEDQANCFSRWTLNYLTPLMKLGTEKILEAEDCGTPLHVDRAEYAYSRVQAAWKEEIAAVEAANVKAKRTKREPNLSMVLLRSFGVEAHLCYDCLRHISAVTVCSSINAESVSVVLSIRQTKPRQSMGSSGSNGSFPSHCFFISDAAFRDHESFSGLCSDRMLYHVV